MLAIPRSRMSHQLRVSGRSRAVAGIRVKDSSRLVCTGRLGWKNASWRRCEGKGGRSGIGPSPDGAIGRSAPVEGTVEGRPHAGEFGWSLRPVQAGSEASGRGRGQRLPVLPVEIDRLLDDLAQLVEDFPLVVTVTAAQDQPRRTPAVAPVLLGRFDNLRGPGAILHASASWTVSSGIAFRE